MRRFEPDRGVGNSVRASRKADCHSNWFVQSTTVKSWSASIVFVISIVGMPGTVAVGPPPPPLGAGDEVPGPSVITPGTVLKSGDKVGEEGVGVGEDGVGLDGDGEGEEAIVGKVD